MLSIINNGLNLGTIKYQVSTHGKFILKNEYSTSITIISISPGCGSCTTASSSSNVIQSGENFSIDFVFTPNSIDQGMIKTITIDYTVSGSVDTKDIKLTFSSDVTS